MQLYKILQPFEFDNKQRKIGEEIVCSAREGEELMKKKLVTMADKELDPDNPRHQPLMKEASARKEAKHAELQADKEAREEAKNDREGEKDEKLAKKREETVALAKELGREDLSRIEAMNEEALDKEIGEMKAAADAGPAKGENKDETPATPNPSTKRTPENK